MLSMSDDKARGRKLYAIQGGRSAATGEPPSQAKLPLTTAMWFMASGFFVSATVVGAFTYTGQGWLTLAALATFAIGAMASFVIGSFTWPEDTTGLPWGSANVSDEYIDWDYVTAVLNSAQWLMLSGALAAFAVCATTMSGQFGGELLVVGVVAAVAALASSSIGCGIFTVSQETVASKTWPMITLPEAPVATNLSTVEFVKEARPVAPVAPVASPCEVQEPLNPICEEPVELEPVAAVAVKDASPMDEASTTKILELLVSLESFALNESQAPDPKELLARLESLATVGLLAEEPGVPERPIESPRPVAKEPLKVEF